MTEYKSLITLSPHSHFTVLMEYPEIKPGEDGKSSSKERGVWEATRFVQCRVKLLALSEFPPGLRTSLSQCWLDAGSLFKMGGVDDNPALLPESRPVVPIPPWGRKLNRL